MINSLVSNNSQTANFRISSPSAAMATHGIYWTFPKPVHLINLLKCLSKTTIVRIISDKDCPNFIGESYYLAFVNSLSRSQDEPKELSELFKAPYRGLMGTIDI